MTPLLVSFQLPNAHRSPLRDASNRRTLPACLALTAALLPWTASSAQTPLTLIPPAQIAVRLVPIKVIPHAPIVPPLDERTVHEIAILQSMERANLVIVGEFVALDADAYGEDGYASTITFKVGEVFKGTAPPTGKVHLRQESGMTGWVAEGRIFSVTPGDIATMSKSAPEFVGPPKGTKYVLYLSDTLYSRPAVAAKHKTMTRGGPYYLSVDDTYRLSDDGRLLPTEGRCWVAVKSLTTLAEVRAAAARYKSRALQSETGRLPN